MAPVIDTAAMPIRVERWTADNRVFYRIVGIVWGGSQPTERAAVKLWNWKARSGGSLNRERKPSRGRGRVREIESGEPIPAPAQSVA